MTFYASIQSTSDRLLDQFGQDGTYTWVESQVVDPITGTQTGGTPSTQTVRVVITPFDKREIDGALVQAQDLQVLSGQGFEPKIGYTLSVGGQSYEVISVDQVNPAGTPVLFKAQVRA